MPDRTDRTMTPVRSPCGVSVDARTMKAAPARVQSSNRDLDRSTSLKGETDHDHQHAVRDLGQRLRLAQPA
jgi:hypothetical protein